MQSKPTIQRPSIKIATRRRRTKTELGTGWLPDLPDFRDYSAQTESVRALFRQGPPRTAALAQQADLRQFCSPVGDQGQLGSCTAQAIIAWSKFERRAHNEHSTPSPFIYKGTQALRVRGAPRHVRGAISRSSCSARCPKSYGRTVSEFEGSSAGIRYAFAQSYRPCRLPHLARNPAMPWNVRRALHGLHRVRVCAQSGRPVFYRGYPFPEWRINSRAVCRNDVGSTTTKTAHHSQSWGRWGKTFTDRVRVCRQARRFLGARTAESSPARPRRMSDTSS